MYSHPGSVDVTGGGVFGVVVAGLVVVIGGVCFCVVVTVGFGVLCPVYSTW